DDLGFVDTLPLDRGVNYDTSERRIGGDDRELQLMGAGDIRLLCRREIPVSGDRFRLPDPPDGKGSPYDDGPAVMQFAAPLARIAGALDALEQSGRHEMKTYKILVSRSVHSKVRSLLEADHRFDEASLHQHLSGLSTLL